MANAFVRDVIERNKHSTPAAPSRDFLKGSGALLKTGFPAVHHRSKGPSAFKLARQDERVQNELDKSNELLASAYSRNIPAVSIASPKAPNDAEDWMEEISRKNEELVAQMSVDERNRERQDIIDKFGTGIDDLMIKVREARIRRGTHHANDAPNASDAQASSNAIPSPDHPRSSQPPAGPRKIRFVDPTEADVYIYESQPPSPRRTLGLLPPPDANRMTDDIPPLHSFKSATNSSVGPSPSSNGHSVVSTEEGTPEDIRRRFFPSEAPPEVNPALAWMLPTSVPSSERSHPSDDTLSPDHVGLIQEPRYSLLGIRLSSAEMSNLPTHLGLHHHASSSLPSGALAGYTLADLLLLSRSTVPAQRASILGVLVKLLRNAQERNARYPFSCAGPIEGDVPEAPDDIDIDVLRRDLVDAAIHALGEKGSVGKQGLELLWEIVVGFTRLNYGVDDLKDLARTDFTLKNSTSQSSASSLAIIVSLPVAMILPMLRQLLITSPSVLSRVHTQVLEVLVVLSHFKAHAHVIVHTDAGHAVVATMMQSHLRSPFGPEDGVPGNDNWATPASIHILQALAASNRENAVKLVGPADLLLRYVAEPHFPPTYLHPHNPGYLSFTRSMALLEETLQFYDILLRYGLYSQIATIAQDHFSRIGGWILTTMRTELDFTLVSLSRAYVSLLRGMIVCATDPHQTTPSHDILWSQVQGWGWIEWLMEFVELLALVHGTSLSVSCSLVDVAIQGLWADVLHTIVAWLEGASINGVKGGESENVAALDRLRPLFQTNHEAWNIVTRAIETLRACKIRSNLETSSLYPFAQAAELLAATMELATSSIRPNMLEKPFQFPDQEFLALCTQLAEDVSSQGPFSLSQGHGQVVSENAHTFLKPLSSLMVAHLKFWHRSMYLATDRGSSVQSEQWTTQALHVLRALLPGDEEHARWIVTTICDTINPSFVRQILPTTEVPAGFWAKGGIKLLLPFLSDNIWPDRGHRSYIAPTSPSPQSIFQCTTLNVPAVSHLRETWASYDRDATLPLRNDWSTGSLNHLLRSGTSPIFHKLPPNWDASETEVVRASLLLANVIQGVGDKLSADIIISFRMSSAEAIFACMKIFMLEEGQQPDSNGEVFRDMFVSRWMDALLEPFTYSRSPHILHKKDHSSRSLERVSKAFLPNGTPFYQFYTDFLGLYDSISFSHALFARLLLPPISMSYPADYRKLLFGDFGHLLRTVKTDVQDLICHDVRDYFWPVERDAHVVGWYLKSLVTAQAHGFIHWLAVHHVAANIWPEFTHNESGSRDLAGKLLSALLLQGKDEIVREVVLYRQEEHELRVPPDCFVSGEIAWRMARLEWAREVGGEQAKSSLESLLLD